MIFINFFVFIFKIIPLFHPLKHNKLFEILLTLMVFYLIGQLPSIVDSYFYKFNCKIKITFSHVLNMKKHIFLQLLSKPIKSYYHTWFIVVNLSNYSTDCWGLFFFKNFHIFISLNIMVDILRFLLILPILFKMPPHLLTEAF